MMRLSEQMMNVLKQQLRDNPLGDDEIRRIEGMGELYVSKETILEGEYSFLYSLKIDDEVYRFYGRNLNGK